MFNEYNLINTNSSINFEEDMFNILSYAYSNKIQIIFYFIGTDRCTGDALGPIVGEFFRNTTYNGVLFYGSLDKPMHAENIEDIISYNRDKDSLVIAVDASLGRLKDVGKVIIQDKPMYPGAALNKSIPPIGNYSITGIVNIYDKFDFIILQNTRLNTVFTLANFISKGINQALIRCVTKEKSL